MTPILTVENIWKRYAPDREPVVCGVDFELYPGEILALLGPSGCGKTTTLRAIAGFEHIEQGRITLNGTVLADKNTHVPPEHRDIGIVFQEFALFPHLNVLKNVAFGLKGMSRKEKNIQAHGALDTVGMKGLCQRNPHELSGGQQQRVALARSLAPGPRIILLDEPFSNLDAGLRAEMRAEVREILKRTGMTAILVTHDREEALTFADRIAVMHDGRIDQIGDPISIYRDPATAFVAQFLGNTNLIPAIAHGDHADTALGTLALSRPASGEVLLSVRPEHLAMTPGTNGGTRATITKREFKGHDQIYRVRVGDHEFVIMTDHKGDFAEGTQVSIHPTEPATVLNAPSE
ncbi:MAG: ABC transporter ATP-binding protein [Candidatus Hydrogenedentes bacterium]|nr:ABC transporter ATP-binding protein [Candidatus Hydrogenedentota bacterium]